MAGMQIMPVGGFSIAPIETGRVQNVRAASPDTPEKVSEKKNDSTDQQKELEDVVSVSEDGDTVQVKEDSEKKLEDDRFGHVDIVEQELAGVYNAPAETPNIEIKAPEKPEDEEEIPAIETKAQGTQITSYAGYTDSQLEQMYLKGEISKNDYDKEIEAREAREEALKGEDEETSELAGKLAGSENKEEQDEIELKKVFSEDASDTLTAKQRADAIDTLQNMALGITN
ncbi:MAG: hypothetical protein IJT16_13610 [Lachnospiraceae bacterium]|nr:hypothetical protein [Lachnospiraceae bacterium]